MNILDDSNIIQLPEDALATLLSGVTNSFVFIKNSLSVYQYANPSFVDASGLKSVNELRNLNDYDLCNDKKKNQIFREMDEYVIDTGGQLEVCSEVEPKYNTLFRECLKGTLYPIFNKGSQPIAVMGIVNFQRSQCKLTLESAISMSPIELSYALTKRSWTVTAFNREITISRRELQCLIELIKGYHAGEIAATLLLKQTTVESYIDNIKNKLGATSRSSLINTVFNQKIIQQITL